MISQFRTLWIVSTVLSLAWMGRTWFPALSADAPVLKAAFSHENTHTVYTLQEVDVPPIPVNMDQVRQEIGYPEFMMLDGIQGTEVFLVQVDATGRYVSQVSHQSSHPLLRMAAEDYLSHLSFRPALRQGQMVACWTQVSVSFPEK
ncbi:MAG: energy transducer TonB [Bacteroidia bacterium]|nr:energy transducer TonB [Bacteroidia bacterium]